MEKASLDKYTRLKRRIYLVIFPILILTNASYWFFSSQVDQLMRLTLPPLCLFLTIIWLLICTKRWVRACELISLAVFSIYHLIRVYTMTIEFEEGIVNAYVLWSTTYFIFIFMVLKRKRALAFSFLIFMITISIGIPRINDMLIHYYLSTLIYIIIMFYFQRIVSAYIELDLLKKNAYYDALTNIGNRRSIDLWIEMEIKKAQNTNHLFSIIYFDIDHFKHINDEHGHDVGDHVLKEFVAVIKKVLEPNQFLGRWGGDEFIIILQGQPLEEATKLAETLRILINNHSFRYIDELTSSFGVVAFESYDTAKTLIKSADQALYMAKNSGRNKIQTI